MMTPAEKTAQRDAALERATRIRLARAALRQAIAAGTRSVGDVLRDPPEEALTMPIGELLAAQHQWGAKRAARLLAPLRIHELRKVADLTERQRRMIAECIDFPPEVLHPPGERR